MVPTPRIINLHARFSIERFKRQLTGEIITQLSIRYLLYRKNAIYLVKIRR